MRKKSALKFHSFGRVLTPEEIQLIYEYERYYFNPKRWSHIIRESYSHYFELKPLYDELMREDTFKDYT